MFGESRIEFDEASDDEPSSAGASPEDPRKRPVHVHQAMYIPDEDLPLRLIGLHVSGIKWAAWSAGCILSGGTLWLIGRWVPSVWLKGVGVSGEFERASYVVIEVRLCWHSSSSVSSSASSVSSPRTTHRKSSPSKL